jgi:hypothetical protein
MWISNTGLYFWRQKSNILFLQLHNNVLVFVLLDCTKFCVSSFDFTLVLFLPCVCGANLTGHFRASRWDDDAFTVYMKAITWVATLQVGVQGRQLS